MFRRLLILVTLALCALHAAAGSASAQEKPKREWQGGPFHMTASLKGGGFLPSESTLESYYGKGSYYISVRVGVLAEHKAFGQTGSWTLPGTLGLNLEGGFYRATGRETTIAPFPELALIMMPATLGIEYGFRFSEEQLIVPYVGAGGAAAYFKETVKLIPEDVVDGGRFGWFAEVGLRLNIDRFDRAAERAFTHSVGVRNTFIDVRARYHAIDGFDRGIDLSGLVFDGGFTFDF